MIQDLRKVYASGVEALRGIDLTVEEGDFYALLGPNGAGKSTTIGIVTSLVNKTSGKVKIFGYDLDNDAAKAERYLEKKNVQLLLNSPIVEVAADHIKLKDGSEVPTHTLIWTAGVKATSDAADFGLEAARGSRLVANEYMQLKATKTKTFISLVTWFITKKHQIHQLLKLFKQLNKQVILRLPTSLQILKVAKNTPLKETTKDSWFPSARNGALPTYSIKFI